ncbi:MAG: hypothetical protein HY060_23235 [Proteobacteria bacterium]|nr:hypothetical protein [Pseudomonadota bacterium]
MAEMTVPAARPRRRIVSTALWIMAPLVLIFALPTVILMVLGLLPTIVAWFVDRRDEKYAAYCVGGFNLSGVIPYLFVLWAGGDTMHALSKILTNPFAWLVMFGAAAIGWLANYWAPQVTMRIRRARDRGEAARLRKRQEQILEEWGPEVMPPE